MNIGFQYPVFLWGLFFLAVPILIHLFQIRRYKKEFFSNIAMLEQLQKEHKQQSQLKHQLILLSRMLAIACLVLAFARPFLWQNKQGEETFQCSYYSLYIDNSYSMGAPYQGTTILEYAKKEAVHLVHQLPYESKIQILTNEFEGNQQQFVSTAEALKRIESIDLCSGARSLQEVFQRQKALFSAMHLKPSQIQRILFSDFQKSTAGSISDSSAVYYPLQASAFSDWSLDSLALEAPIMPYNKEGVLQVWLGRRQGEANTEEEIPVRLFLEGSPISVISARIQGRGVQKLEFPFKLPNIGFYQGELRIEDETMPFDNVLYFTLYCPKEIKILQIYDTKAEPSIDRLWGEDSAFILEQVSIRHLDYTRIQSASLLVLDGLNQWPSALVERVKDYMKNGGQVAVIPPPQVQEMSGLNTCLKSMNLPAYGLYKKESRRVEKINLKHRLWQKALSQRSQIDLGTEINVHAYYVLPQTTNSEDVLSFFLRSYPIGKGQLYLFACPWEKSYTDFTQSYAFVVCLLNMALEGRSNLPLYFSLQESGWEVPFLDGAEMAYANKIDPVLFLRRTQAIGDDSSAYIPEIRRMGNTSLLYGLSGIPAGNYRLSDAKGQFVSALSIQESRSEAEMDYYRAKDWKQSLGRNPISEFGRGGGSWKEASSFWKILLIFALVFVLVETILLRKR